MILKQVHDTNMRAKGHPERVFTVSILEKYLLQSLKPKVEKDAKVTDNKHHFINASWEKHLAILQLLAFITVQHSECIVI